ncbi:hypothetical protein [Amycolatopsis rifamycinica]|uniref:hypothetical protein n=1 Tax=Amycolatopsis rifamycinica TaxID=287986 RepID=UPI00126A10B8|nr:hypothetical protein [Amycolatopsis rifamycinica]
MQKTTTAGTPPTSEPPHPPAEGPATRLLALLPNPIPPWPLLLALVAILGTVTIIALAILHSIGPTLATAGALSSVIGAGIHWSKRHTRGRAKTRP